MTPLLINKFGSKMKKPLITLMVCLIFLPAVALSSQDGLANENKDGLYVRTIEQVLRMEPEQVDIGIAALIVSEQWSDAVAGCRCQKQLDDMAYEIRDRLQKKGLKANQQAIPIINEYLFDELGFKTVKEANDPNDLFLHSVLKNKRGYCLSLSVLYLAIGERLGLPLFGVVVPGHFFVRYDDGKNRFNIETTSKGGTAPDEYYRDKFKVPQSGADNIYMKNLNSLQTIGCFFNNLGNSYESAGNLQRAQESLEKAVAINQSLVEARSNLGNIYMQTNRIDDAIFQYRNALQWNPDDARVHNNLGNAYSKKGWQDSAIAQYRQSIQNDPNLIDAYKNIAVIYCELKSFDLAITNLQKALVKEPKEPVLYIQLGGAYLQKGSFKEALAQLNKAVSLQPNSAQAYYNFGLCYKGLGNEKSEIDAYKKALSIQPNMPPALVSLGNVYFAQKHYDQALEQYQLAARLRPDDDMLFYNIGAAYSNKNDHKQATDAYTKAITINPSMADAHYGLAYSLYHLQDYQASLEHLKKAESLGVKIDADLLADLQRRLK